MKNIKNINEWPYFQMYVFHINSLSLINFCEFVLDGFVMELVEVVNKKTWRNRCWDEDYVVDGMRCRCRCVLCKKWNYRQRLMDMQISSEIEVLCEDNRWLTFSYKVLSVFGSNTTGCKCGDCCCVLLLSIFLSPSRSFRIWNNKKKY